jgi:adenylate cyclase
MKVLFCLKLAIITLFLLTCSNSKQIPPKAVKGVLDLRDWDFDPTRGSGTDGIVNLDGEWEFYWKEFPVGDSLELPEDKKDYLEVPRAWNGKVITRKTSKGENIEETLEGEGYATYRLKVLLKEEMDLGIKLPRQGTSYILFINGKKYLQSGRVGVNRESSAPDRIFHYLPIFSKTKEIELLVSISNYTDVEGGFWSSLEFGNRKSIFKQKDSHWFRDIFISGIIFIMGIYHFSLFYLRKEDKSPLFFGIFCLIICLRALLTEERVILSLIENFNYRLSLSLEYLTMYLGIPTFLKFVHSLFPEELNLFINKGLSYISYFCASIVIFFSPIIFTQTLGTMQFIVVITIIFIIYSVIIALRKKKDGAGVILVGFSLFALTMINDVLHNRGIIQTGYYVSSGLVAFIFAQSYLLSARFSKAFTDAKEARRIAEEQRQLVQSAKEEIERLNRTKDEFLANLSHEIKTPLVTIYGYSELITQEEDLPESTKEYGAEIYKSAGMLNSYMDDVLLVTDLETNLQLDKKPYSL